MTKHVQPSLKALRLRHFRAFSDSKDVPLRKLTLLFGRNNSGKSTVLQSLLLLKQTIDSPEYGPRLNTHGPLVESGVFGDLVHQHKGFSFQWSISVGLEDGTDAQVHLEFVKDDEGHLARLARLVVEHESVDRVEFKRGPGKGGPYELRINSALVGSQSTANFKFSSARFFPLVGEEPPKVGAPNKRRARSRDLARRVLETIEGLLGKLRTVGAFRRSPLSRYEYLGRVSDAADPTGEHVVQALIQDSTGRRRGLLVASVNEWLAQVGRVRLMPIKGIRGTRLFELRLQDTDSGRWANFAQVGYGIGQALPVLVEGLRTPEGGIFMVQEPEINLHPDAQLAMGDFLVDLAMSGRQVIVETHSEAILLRVRHRMLTSESSRQIAPADVGVVIVDKQRGGTSFTRSLEPDDLGQLSNWPKGFLEDLTRERLDLLAAMADRVEQ